MIQDVVHQGTRPDTLQSGQSPLPISSLQGTIASASESNWKDDICDLTQLEGEKENRVARVRHERSDSWEVLQEQIKAAEATDAFVFSHRRLDNLSSVALAQYLRDDCQAKFIDLSYLGCWASFAGELAAAVGRGTRRTRSLVLDGNSFKDCLETFETWCSAIGEHPGLQHVSFRDAGLDDSAMKSVATLIRSNTVLFSIDLGLNPVNTIGIHALIDAIGRNDILLEVYLDGCRMCHEMHARLSEALQRNRDRFPRQGSCVLGLRDLRKARAKATTVLSAHDCQLQDYKLSARNSRADVDEEQTAILDKRPGSHLLAVYASMDPGELRPIPIHEPNEEADGVFYDAGLGPSIELNNRCEAGWRYTATDRETLLDLRKLTDEIKACRKLEKTQGDDAMQRVASIRQSYREQALPVEQHIIKLKEDLSHEIELTKNVLQERIKLKLALQSAEEELEQAEQESTCHHLGKQKLENLLKSQNREVQEQVERLQMELSDLDEGVQKIADDNERCRKLLHALRFETETERFVPKAALEQKAAQEALEKEESERRERQRAEAEAESEQAMRAAQDDLKNLQGRARRRSMLAAQA